MTRDLLTGGTFTSFRMISTYSLVSALGLSPRASRAARLAVLAAAVAVLVKLRLAGREPRVVLSLGLGTGGVLLVRVRRREALPAMRHPGPALVPA